MIETLVIVSHSDVGVDLKLDRVEFFDSFLWWSENCKRGDGENK